MTKKNRKTSKPELFRIGKDFEGEVFEDIVFVIGGDSDFAGIEFNIGKITELADGTIDVDYKIIDNPIPAELFDVAMFEKDLSRALITKMEAVATQLIEQEKSKDER